MSHEFLRAPTPAAPVPLERQIKRMQAEIQIVRNIKEKQIKHGRIHPGAAAVELHELTAILRTLEELKAKNDPQPEPATADPGYIEGAD